MVKRAYLDCAMRYHPDRLTDRSAHAVELAEFRMREVNGAWEVLRNPAARARYDDELRAASGAAPGAGTAPLDPGERSRRAGFEPEPVRVADLAPLAPAGYEEPRLSPWWKYGPVLVGGAVLVVLLVFTASAVNRHDRPATIRTVEEYPLGSCVLIAPSEDNATDEPGAQAVPAVMTVTCDGVRSGKVVDKTTFPLTCPSGTAAFLLRDRITVLCLVP